jgi:transcriptional regulator with XRE-family HTH domain
MTGYPPNSEFAGAWEQVVSFRLKKMREWRGMSQSDLAEESGLMVSAISHFECGRRMPSAFNIFRLATALRCRADYLLLIWSPKERP